MQVSSGKEGNERRPSRARSVVAIASESGVVIGGIAAVVSIVISLHQLASEQAKMNDAAEQTKKYVQASSLTAIIQLLDREVAIKSRIQSFLTEYSEAEKVTAVFKRFESGNKAYYSKEFDDLREVGHHYEALGALVKKGYIDEDLIYATVDFPREFWKRTAGFREMIRTENWNGAGSTLPDFWENFEWLYTRYETKHQSPNNE